MVCLKLNDEQPTVVVTENDPLVPAIPEFFAVGTKVRVIVGDEVTTHGTVAEFFIHESGREYYRLDTPRFPWLYRVPASLVFLEEE